MDDFVRPTINVIVNDQSYATKEPLRAADLSSPIGRLFTQQSQESTPLSPTILRFLSVSRDAVNYNATVK